MSLSSQVSALAQRVSQEVKAVRADSMMKPVSGTVSLPSVPEGTLLGYRATAPAVFQGSTSSASLPAGAYIFERVALPVQWRYRVVDEGKAISYVGMYEDFMTTARPSIYGSSTPVGGGTWKIALGAAIGNGSPGTGAMKVAGGQALRNGTVGAGAYIDTHWIDMRVVVGYNVGLGGTGAQVRALTRNDPDYNPNPYDDRRMPIQAIIKGDGSCTFEPWLDGPTWRQKPMATGLPLSGTLELEVVGAQAKVFVNGVQVGDTQILSHAHTLEGQVAGFGVYDAGVVTSFRAEAIE